MKGTVLGIGVAKTFYWAGIGVYISGNIPAIEDSASSGTEVATLTLVGNDDVSFTWSLLDDAGGFFNIDSSSGIITLSTNNPPAGTYTIEAQAVGSPSNSTVTRVFFIVVNGTSVGNDYWLPTFLMQKEI